MTLFEDMSEKKLLDKLESMFEEKKPSILKKIFSKVNLATKQFRDIWLSWWEGELPPRQEVDLILVVADSIDVYLIGIEVEYFKTRKKNPYVGLEQAISFSLFGFNYLVLWHIFAPNLQNNTAESYVRPIRELVDGLNLPINYIATKIFEDETFEFFAPFSTSYRYDARYLLSRLIELCRKKPNPLLYSSEVQQRRDVLKVILKIPR